MQSSGKVEAAGGRYLEASLQPESQLENTFLGAKFTLWIDSTTMLRTPRLSCLLRSLFRHTSELLDCGVSGAEIGGFAHSVMQINATEGGFVTPDRNSTAIEVSVSPACNTVLPSLEFVLSP